MKISIGRTSGPCTDIEVSSEFTESQIPIVKDVLAMVNAVSSDKERWYIIIGDERFSTVPSVSVKGR